MKSQKMGIIVIFKLFGSHFHSFTDILKLILIYLIYWSNAQTIEEPLLLGSNGQVMEKQTIGASVTSSSVVTNLITVTNWNFTWLLRLSDKSSVILGYVIVSNVDGILNITNLVVESYFKDRISIKTIKEQSEGTYVRLKSYMTISEIWKEDNIKFIGISNSNGRLWTTPYIILEPCESSSSNIVVESKSNVFGATGILKCLNNGILFNSNGTLLKSHKTYCSENVQWTKTDSAICMKGPNVTFSGNFSLDEGQDFYGKCDYDNVSEPLMYALLYIDDEVVANSTNSSFSLRSLRANYSKKMISCQIVNNYTIPFESMGRSPQSRLEIKYPPRYDNPVKCSWDYERIEHCNVLFTSNPGVEFRRLLKNGKKIDSNVKAVYSSGEANLYPYIVGRKPTSEDNGTYHLVVESTYFHKNYTLPFEIVLVSSCPLLYQQFLIAVIAGGACFVLLIICTISCCCRRAATFIDNYEADPREEPSVSDVFVKMGASLMNTMASVKGKSKTKLTHSDKSHQEHGAPLSKAISYINSSGKEVPVASILKPSTMDVSTRNEPAKMSSIQEFIAASKNLSSSGYKKTDDLETIDENKATSSQKAKPKSHHVKFEEDLDDIDEEEEEQQKQQQQQQQPVKQRKGSDSSVFDVLATMKELVSPLKNYDPTKSLLGTNNTDNSLMNSFSIKGLFSTEPTEETTSNESDNSTT